MSLRGLDNWITGGRFSDEEISCECPNGHHWEAPGYREYGAVCFADEEAGPTCPRCKRLDLESMDGESVRSNCLPHKGYRKGADDVWRIPPPPEDDWLEAAYEGRFES